MAAIYPDPSLSRVEVRLWLASSSLDTTNIPTRRALALQMISSSFLGMVVDPHLYLVAR
jgi:hypothetical protein